MNESAHAIVVGGGVLGASAALHLVNAGLDDVVLLERDDLAQGTSSAGGGLVAQMATGYIPPWKDEELAIERYGLDFYRQLAEDGFDFDYKRNGSLWTATTEEAWDTYIASCAANEAVPDRQILSPEEVEEVTGIIPAAGVVSGLLYPNGCQVSAKKASQAVAERYRSQGGRIEVRTPVERLLVENGRIVGVETTRGTYHAEIVVLAAGAWTNTLLRRIGCWVPMVPLVQSRIVTEPLGVPPTMPTLMLQEFAFIWLREERGGLLWGSVYVEPPRYAYVEDEPPNRFDQQPFDGVQKVQRDGIDASRAIPVLSRYRSMTISHGAPCYTPDLRAMVGPVPGVGGLHVIGGCNESGVTHGPGWGKLLADNIVRGRSELTEIDVFRPDRFGDRYPTGPDVVTGMNELAGWIFAGDSVESRPDV